MNRDLIEAICLAMYGKYGYPPSGNTETGPGIQRIPFDSILQDLLTYAQKQAEKEKEYFIPKLDDFNIDYECEMLTDRGWKQYIIHSSRAFIDNMIKNSLRTPYLTKEQIEKEGWKYEPLIGLVIAHKFTKGDYILNWFWNDKKIFIYKMKKLWPGSVNYELEPLYKGICPSINEFRTIMKLLNIK
jgi:hypothetical protein